MIVSENTQEFASFLKTTSIENISLECPFCHCEFTKKKREVQSKFGQHNNRKAIFCSYKCSTLSQRNRNKVTCLQCNFVFDKLPNQVRRSQNHFCSRSCAARYRNTHKVKGNRRSKLEIWLEEKLTSLYPELVIRYNCKDVIQSELDIYIPSLCIAFELNGVFHYKPIYGKDKLLSIQSNDYLKYQACLEIGIELIIIDTSAQKCFNVSTSQKFLDTIIEGINIKLSPQWGSNP